MRVVNRGMGVVYFLSVFPFPLFLICSLHAQGAASHLVIPAAAGHQLLFEQSESIRTPMMSCLTWGSRLGRNPPHLSDDPLRTSSSVEQRSTLRPNQIGNCVS